MKRNDFNPTLWEAYRSEIAEKGCTICEHYSENVAFGVKIKVCARNHPWVGKTTINRCKSGRVKE